jgi:hypothetical protein
MPGKQLNWLGNLPIARSPGSLVHGYRLSEDATVTVTKWPHVASAVRR